VVPWHPLPIAREALRYIESGRHGMPLNGVWHAANSVA